MGFTPELIHALNDIPTRTIYRWIERYRTFDTVLTLSEKYGDDRGRPRIISDDDLLVMCYVWSRDPTLHVEEVADEMSEILDKEIDAYNLRYWMDQLGITRKKLWKVCPSLLLFV